jgi:hypothetical protein
MAGLPPHVVDPGLPRVPYFNAETQNGDAIPELGAHAADRVVTAGPAGIESILGSPGSGQ